MSGGSAGRSAQGPPLTAPRIIAAEAEAICPSVHRAGFFGTIVEYGAERKISRHSVLGAAVSVGVPQGVSLKIK